MRNLKEKNLKIQVGLSLDEFLIPKLVGSTLSVRKITETDLYVESDEIIQIHVKIDTKEKKITEELYSPKWVRPITVQEIGGTEFLELQAEEELQKGNFEEIAEDILLTFDLIASWAKANKMIVVEQKVQPENPAELEEQHALKRKKDQKAK